MHGRLGSLLPGSTTPPPPGPSYTETILINQAAIQGQGIAIGRSALVDDALTQGLLVRPFEIVRPADYAYWIIMTPSTARNPRGNDFSRLAA